MSLILLCELQAEEKPPKTNVETVEVVQQLREGAVLLRGPRFILNTHMAIHNNL